MKLRIYAAVALTVFAATLTSCTAASSTGGTNAAASAPAPASTAAATPPAAATSPQGDIDVTLPADGSAPTIAGMTLAPADPSLGQPMPESELADSRTAKHLRYLASRLDAYLAANGVPSDWETNGFDYISTIWTQAEDDAWDKDISTGFMGRPDGSYSIRGWSLTGADPKHDSFNTGLEYDSVKGFITG